MRPIIISVEQLRTILESLQDEYIADKAKFTFGKFIIRVEELILSSSLKNASTVLIETSEALGELIENDTEFIKNIDSCRKTQKSTTSDTRLEMLENRIKSHLNSDEDYPYHVCDNAPVLDRST